ncbi:HepT-like ribonuclease domain-containing protein [Eggerthella lenta]|uniref:HepT-like ribonuclease domain-containing protein n=1 Tax=Eggerthella lenta TaxID=84112 RepID=UPI0031B5D888
MQELYPSDMWVQAYGMRNRIAHGYAKLKPAIVWETAITSIPALRELCLRLLED